MGYRSQVALKTTTEGWIVLKRMNDKITKEEDKPLYSMTVTKTATGYYRIFNEYIKWYDEYPNVENFNKALDSMEAQDIPFVFIEIGEDYEDIKIRNNWTDDMPDAIEEFDVNREINDPDEGSYEPVVIEDLFTPHPDDKPDEFSDEKDLVTDELPTTPIDDTHIKEVMFDLFEEYKYYDGIKEALRSLNSEGDVTDEEYDMALECWDEWLKEWEGDDE